MIARLPGNVPLVVFNISSVDVNVDFNQIKVWDNGILTNCTSSFRTGFQGLIASVLSRCGFNVCVVLQSAAKHKRGYYITKRSRKPVFMH